MQCDRYPFGRTESLAEDAIVATFVTYGIGYEAILDKAGAFAVGQTVGTWVKVPGVSEKMVERYQGRVLSVYQAGLDAEGACAHFVLRVAFPVANFGNSLTMLLTALLGNDVSTALRARLVDIELLGNAVDSFSGPQMGIAELRRLTGVTDRPLVLNMIKPCAGFTPQEGATFFHEVAMGGVDMIKDDELLASPAYNEVGARYRAYVAAATDVFERTGHQPLYLPNLSGTPSHLMESARALVEAGGKACLVNFVFGGPDALRELCDAFGDKLFIMAHYAGVGALGAYDCGVENAVFLGTLPRLAGAHAVMTMAPPPDNPRALYDFRRTVQAQRLPMGNIAPLVTTVGGGVTPISQACMQRELGQDTIIGIGGAIQGHPMGATAGAQAAMAAVKATAAGVSLRQAAAGCEPLAAAMEQWGE